MIAVDGKSMRGASCTDGTVPHLLSALTHDAGIVAGQLAVDTKSIEIPALPVLLDQFDLTGVVVTADALHCQRGTAEHIIGRGGHFALTVKDNQPTLRKQLKALPWSKVPATSSLDTSHGRRVRRTIRGVDAPPWLDFPGAAQVLQVWRTRIIKGRRHTEVVYVTCSLDTASAPRADVAAWVRGHWRIGNALHGVRDVTFDEDRHQLRTGHAPQAMTTLRNTTISLLRHRRMDQHRRLAPTLRPRQQPSRRPHPHRMKPTLPDPWSGTRAPARWRNPRVAVATGAHVGVVRSGVSAPDRGQGRRIPCGVLGHREQAVLAEARRVRCADPSRFDRVTVIGSMSTWWGHTRWGDKHVT